MKNEQSEKPLHVVELRADNLKRVVAVSVKPDGNMVIIGGKNGAGKSSLLDSLEYALAGTKALPSDPIRRGARKGRVVVDLGEIIVERTFSSKGTQLVVKNAAGEPQKSPQTLLDQLCSKVAFDPFGFTREEPKKQDAILRDVMGIDFSELDAKRATAYDRRRDINRDVKKLSAQVDGMQLHAVPDKEVSVAELSEALEEVRDICQENEKQRDAVADKEVSVAELSEALEEVRDICQENEKQRDAVADKAEELGEIEEAIAETEKEIAKLQKRLAEQQQDRDELKAEHAHLLETVSQLTDPDPEPIRQQIATAEETNRKVRENRRRKQLEKELAALEKQADECTAEIERVDEEKAAQLAAAKFPVEGLGFDDTGPTLNGIPLEQCSQAERLRVSVAIGAALNPRVKVMLVRDGALLDEDSMRMLAELAAETGAQVWLERVGDGDESAIVIEDGMVREAERGAAE